MSEAQQQPEEEEKESAEASDEEIQVNCLVPEDILQAKCPVCKEEIEKYWDDEQEDWFFKGAVNVDGIVIGIPHLDLS